MHDPAGILFPRWFAATPALKRIFDTAFFGISAGTVKSQPEYVSSMAGDPFFRLLLHEEPMPVGDEFRSLYAHAAAVYPAVRRLHLCFPDRLAFAVDGEHRLRFLNDIAAIQSLDVPVLFQRSEAAWQSHPNNYRQLEALITSLGVILFGRSLDFAWCHLVVAAGQLAAVLPNTERHDICLMAELIILLRNEIQTRDVDWLAWEDPFVLGRDPQLMKAERESSTAEVNKRLSYVLPMLEVLAESAGESGSKNA
jgi:hypothetical protein